MKWQQEKPTKPGIYLCCNPNMEGIIRKDLYDLGGRLKTGIVDGAVFVDDMDSSFLWLGPLPYPTPEERMDALQCSK